MESEKKSPFPRKLRPMLASLGALPAQEEEFAFEIKWDGVRALAYVEDSHVHLESRNLNDITARYPELQALAADVGAGHRAVLDGEVVAFDDAGKPSFGRLQARMHLADPREVAARMADTPVCFFLFDLLHLDGADPMPLPWTERRRLLEGLEL